MAYSLSVRLTQTLPLRAGLMYIHMYVCALFNRYLFIVYSANVMKDYIDLSQMQSLENDEKTENVCANYA